ncbi:MAG: UDP-N-acetylglucosamine 2-epimerase, partial [Candidatus Norongarragalinales archaeon]
MHYNEQQGKIIVIGIVLGTRPEIIKMAPVIWELRRRKQGEQSKSSKQSDFDFCVIHTGQHYDYEMSQAFFDELELGKPDFFLGAVSARSECYSDAKQTAAMMTRLEALLARKKISVVAVEGDTNSVLAASIVAKKQKRTLAHVEAGARSFDKTMPEEV